MDPATSKIAKGITSASRVYVCVSGLHNHSTTTTYLNQNTDPMVKELIKSMVIDEGITAIRLIKSNLNRWRKANHPHISPLSTAFHPTDRTIYNYVLKYTYLKHQNHIDQLALQIRLDEWSKNKDNTAFFRPYCKNEDGKVESFLLCFQTKWQKDMIQRYGSIGLLDATYKITKYDLPLYFLVVKTNTGYMNVGTFVVLHEDNKSIEEALRIFKDWNPNWSPNYFVTDFDEAERIALKSVFNCLVYICEFHREQAWIRWLNVKENVPISSHKDDIIKLWRMIANCSDKNGIAELVKSLQEHSIYKENSRASAYFTNTWLPVVEEWSESFFSVDFKIKIKTNNGIESMNHVLKNKFLCNHSTKTLLSLFEVIVDEFLPHQLKLYIDSNIKLSESYRMYHKEIPNFLHRRPLFFIKHVYQRYCAAKSALSQHEDVEDLGDGLFKVKSETRKYAHIVNFNIPNCTCEDFQKYFFPCKHMCAVFISPKNNVCFDDLSETYRTSPYITIDEKYNVFKNDDVNILEESRSDGVVSDNVTISIATSVNESQSQSQTTGSVECPPCTTIQRSNALRKRLRESAKNLLNVSYTVNMKSAEEGQVVESAISAAQVAVQELRKQVPRDSLSGIPLLEDETNRPTVPLNLPKRKRVPKKKKVVLNLDL